jgi:hypothetical protein
MVEQEQECSCPRFIPITFHYSLAPINHYFEANVALFIYHEAVNQ